MKNKAKIHIEESIEYNKDDFEIGDKIEKLLKKFNLNFHSQINITSITIDIKHQPKYKTIFEDLFKNKDLYVSDQGSFEKFTYRYDDYKVVKIFFDKINRLDDTIIMGIYDNEKLESFKSIS